jgi:ferredoxin-NADP reductase
MFSLPLEKKIFLNHNTVELVFRLPSPVSFFSGQFALLKTVLDGETVSRAYSFARPQNSENLLSFVIQKKEHGVFSSFVYDVLQEGDFIDILLPFGNMKYLTGTENEVLLISTGIGFPPLLCIARERALEKKPTKTRFLYGVRYPEEVLYEEELRSYETNNIFSSFCVSRGENPVRTDTVLDTLDIDFIKQEVYICGSVPVAESLKKKVREKGVLERNIHAESF